MYEENRKGQRLNMGAAQPTENGQKSMAFLSQGLMSIDTQRELTDY